MELLLRFFSLLLFQLFLLVNDVRTAPRPQGADASVQSNEKGDPVVIVLRPSDLIPKIELPNVEVPDVGAVFADGFPMLPPGFGKVEIPRVDLGIFGRAAPDEEDDCGIVCQMLRTVDQQLGVVHRQIADINRRISQWEGGDNEEDFEEEEVGDVEEEEEADDVEEEEEEEEERGTILDLGDGNLINKDWNNTTVSEEVQEDGSVVKVNATTIYDKEERGNGFSFVHSVRKTKKQGRGDPELSPGEDLVDFLDLLEKQVAGEEEEDFKNEEEEAEQGEEENEIFSKRK